MMKRKKKVLKNKKTVFLRKVNTNFLAVSCYKAIVGVRAGDGFCVRPENRFGEKFLPLIKMFAR